MPKVTQKQLIGQLRGLKEIKPRQEWVILAKSQILGEKQAEFSAVKASSISFIDVIKSMFFQRKLAYSVATLVFVIAGVVGFAQYTMPGDMLFPIKKISEQSEAALTGQTGLRQSVATFNTRINDLAQVAKEGKKNNIPPTISEIDANASQLAKNLKDNPKDSEAIKEIADSLKVLASIPGTDLSENSNVKSLYQAVVESQIADFTEATLTEEQETVLLEVKDLYDQEKYVEALEKILLIGAIK